MKIGIGSDHGGFVLKGILVNHIEALGHDVVDMGTHSEVSCDYPDIAEKVGKAVVAKDVDLGILICGTGIGISMAANKIEGIRAACCENCFSAKMSREHNNANILCLGARVLGDELAKMMVEVYLSSEFQGGRHATRVDKIMAIEQANIQK